MSNKILTIVKKNFKLLFRSKGSSFVIIFGPLLIIVMVGLAFNNSQTFDLRVGVYAPTYTQLTNSVIAELKQANFIVEEYEKEDACIAKIKEGSIHTCMVFPSDFVIQNKATNEVKFYVDNSRQNLVYQVIDTVSQNLEMTQTNLSTDLTSQIINALFASKEEINKDIALAVQMKQKDDQLSTSIDEVKAEAESIDLTYNKIDLSDISTRAGSLQQDAKQIHDRGMNLVALAEDFVIDVKSNTTMSTKYFEDDLKLMKENLEEQYNVTPRKLESLKAIIDSAEVDLNTLDAKIGQAKQKQADIKTKLENIKTGLGNLKNDIETLKASLESVISKIDAIKVTDVGSIVTPFTSSIVPVAVGQTRLGFLFPSLLVLVIMFIGILLSGTLIVVEKNSKAFFRAFTTPTKEWYFLLSTYITTLILLLIQMAIILGLAAYFLKASLFVNFQLTAIIIFITITFFVMLGIGIGLMFSTQEAVTLISISISSVFLLLSNLVLPLESISSALRTAANYNPYVIASVLLRKSLIFRLDIFDLDVRPDLAWLCIYSLIILILMLFIHTVATFKFYQRAPHIKGKPVLSAPEDSYLTLSDGAVIKDKKDLLAYLKRVDDDKFKECCFESKNEFTIWIGNILNEKKLAGKLGGKSRAEMIEVLEEDLRHEHKKIEKIKQKQFREPAEEEIIE